MVITYDMKMNGLKAACGLTKRLQGGHYIQLSYNVVSGDVITSEHCSCDRSSYPAYDDENIKIIACLSMPYTMQEIADLIYWGIMFP